ncbi:hypothetical protein LTS17_000304 [Exophiala oligosperma]
MPDLQAWETLVQAKQAEAAEKIPKEWLLPESLTPNISETGDTCVLDVPRESGLLTAKQLEITEAYDATALLEKLHSGQLTSAEVTEAFCIRAAIAQQVVRLPSKTFFDRALQRARELDSILKNTGKVIGPLHGLPISLKDCFNVEGLPSTIGFTSFIKHGPVKSNSAVVQTLLDLGAVLYVKTNIPQTMMAGDSHNYVFGRTLNPHRSYLSADGSSGGEGALIAMRGSILGVGTDIAGSVRIPAFCNGTYSLRPSADRIPYGGQTSSARKGLTGIKPCAGPLATSVRDLELFTRVVVDSDPWRLDASAIFSPWRRQAFLGGGGGQTKSRLTFGLIVEDPHFPIHPPVMNTLTRAAAALEAAGHQVVKLTTPSIYDAMVLSFRMFAMDPANTAFEHIKASGEPRIPALSSTDLPHEHVRAEYAPLTLESLYDLNVRRAEFQDGFRKLIVENGLDAIIMPAYQSTAPRHDLISWVPYTVLNNLLDVSLSVHEPRNMSLPP